MSVLAYIVAAIFLPLFPLSMLFNRLFARIVDTRLRMLILLVWPMIGLLALSLVGSEPPAWLACWAVLTACLYAFRAVALRDLGLWIAHMATSAWALLWVVTMFSQSGTLLALQAVSFSVPFMLLTWIVSRLESVYGAAYAGTYGGLAESMPRLSMLLILSILAAIGTPLFPAFFTLLAAIAQSLNGTPGIAILMLLVWFLWAWSGLQMIRGMVIGPAAPEPKPDIETAASAQAGVVLVLLAIAGIASVGYLV